MTATFIVRARNEVLGMSVPAMRDAECTAFLQWALPQLDMHWPGFRKVRHQVCKRVRRRIATLGLNGFAAYRERLESDVQEWRALDQFCHVTMSRFFRDRGVFDCLRTGILPAIAERARSERRPARCWSAGCASGEEPYSIRILWDIGLSCAVPNKEMLIVATDIEDVLLARARSGCYDRASLREVPPELIPHAFKRDGSRFCIHDEYRQGVMFVKQDLRSEAPAGPFDIILCRHLAFTYFAPSLRQKVLRMMAERLTPNGFLVVGSHEQLADARFVSVARMPHVFTKVD
ncbi:hypothetical protein MTX26_30885 [Bradyrhizobium sp. ISRA443]|uniref:CheR family methyltransferase n=1 Tax=unclassified Bradyrhizobium TaxID=2631580 RepID=UPI00247AA3EE|nr:MULTISPECIES: CheR family methyltransferase [unclassified Bradyrhizobium]WGR98579.1 hypothetical protein MTX23_30865 [Bradyrhizobium sp. ISRA436]WGS05468.1 hypothetical protein MTX18_30885 [Bradyrhizobium sp. ISRA437]WGS12355.1 hypothetical protein MTX26_30885 [Bradyrhizobium sp. ISRA443]